MGNQTSLKIIDELKANLQVPPYIAYQENNVPRVNKVSVKILTSTLNWDTTTKICDTN